MAFHPEENMRGKILVDMRDDPEFKGREWPWTAALAELPHMVLKEEPKVKAILEEPTLKDTKVLPIDSENIDVPEIVLTNKAYKVGK